jgi:DUF2933 family protein
MSQYLFLLLVLACPLMMIFMMRGHGRGESHSRAGHAGCGDGSHTGDRDEEHISVDGLRRRRDELDQQTADREWQETSSDDRSVERV